MFEKREILHRAFIVFTCVALSGFALSAHGATCSTQSQMSPAQRSTFTGEAHTFGAIVQSGDTQALRAKILPAIASDFDGIAATVTSLKPLVQKATMTVDTVYLLDASKDAPGAERTQFFCGSPIVVLTFNGIPPGTYALVILHATGVKEPQQISLILASAPGNQWQLAGFYAKPMVHADHDGLWYWVEARKYQQTKDNWTAWLYYHIAEGLLSPVDFLSSPNLQKLQQESQQAHPKDFPAEKTQASLLLLTQHPCAKSAGELLLCFHPGEARRDERTVFTGIEHRLEVERRRFAPVVSNVVPLKKQAQRSTVAHWHSQSTCAGAR